DASGGSSAGLGRADVPQSGPSSLAGLVLRLSGEQVSGGLREQSTGVGESPSWLRHRILIPTCEGWNPSSPARFLLIPGASGHTRRHTGADVKRVRCAPRMRPMSVDGGNVLFNTVLFTGNANPALAQEMAVNLGIELGK